MNRNDIHILSRHSNWPEDEVDTALQENIYTNNKSWKKFLQILLLSLGTGFTLAGIVFFFAYNWAHLHKFIKIGMVEALIIILVAVILLSKIRENIKNIILTAAAVLVGVMIAVFGQIYQTGANAYDFFLGWTAFVTLWVVIANFSPLWLVYIILANTSFILYSQQVATNWTDLYVLFILFLSNSIFLIASLLLPKYICECKAPKWFTHTLALASVTYSTLGICAGILFKHELFFGFLLIAAIIIYGAGLIYALKSKSAFYLSIIPFSIIIIVSTYLLKVSQDELMLFAVSMFIIISVTFLIKGLVDIQKKWNHE